MENPGQYTAFVHPTEKSQNGFEYYYKQYKDKLLQFALQSIPDRNEAEDIIQELFTDLYLKKVNFTEIAALNAYLHRAVSNRIRNYLRDGNIYHEHLKKSSLLNYKSYDPINTDLNASELRKRLRHMLAEMPVKYRTVFIMKRIYRLSLAEISGKLQRPKDTIEKQLRKATKLLRGQLDNAGFSKS